MYGDDSKIINKKEINKKLLDAMKHNCILPQEEDILVKYIDSGYFVDFRRKFRGWLMVSNSNPRSKLYLKSSFAIRKEKELHLQDHYFMIHPFSKLRYYWELFMIVILSVLLVVVPIHMAYEESLYQTMVRFGFDIICIVDIIMCFNTGYQNMNTKKIVMKRSKVAYNYLTTWFALDVLMSINVDGPLHWFMDQEAIEKNNLIKVPTSLKILRITTLMRYLNRYREYKQFSLYMFKMVKMLLIYFLLLVWTTSFLYIAKETDQKERGLLLKCFYLVTNVYFLISNGYESVDPNAPPDSPDNINLSILVLEMICLTVGVILQLFFFAQLLQIVSKYNTSKNKYHEMVQQLRDYMKTKDLPSKMTKRVAQYFDFRFQKNYFKEEEILSTLSQKLIEEINIHSCESLITNVNIFKQMPASVVLKMTSVMRQEIFLPNDVIVQASTVGDCMYFISSGTVAVYTPSGKEVCHLSDGNNFGEISLIMDHATRVATVVAVDYCDLFSLSRRDFRVAIEPYPDLLQRTRRIARQRMKNIMLSEHYRNRPDEYFDFSTPEGIADFIEKMYEI